MTALERNGDVVRLASYAPLLAKQGRMQWRPDMIYFDNTNILLTANYYVQQLFGRNQGDVYLPSDSNATNLVISVVQEKKTGDVIAKLVNVTDTPVTSQFNFDGDIQIASKAAKTVLAGDLSSVNTFADPKKISPLISAMTAGKTFTFEVPAHSLTVIRMSASR